VDTLCAQALTHEVGKLACELALLFVRETLGQHGVDVSDGDDVRRHSVTLR
jgi:hypothetical protein